MIYICLLVVMVTGGEWASRQIMYRADHTPEAGATT